MPVPTPLSSPSVGLVLSGGGARGAYEAGVLAAIFELFGARSSGRSTFDVITGTSVGAMNAAHVAAYADRADHGAPELLDRWISLNLETHLRPSLGRFLRSSKSKREASGRAGEFAPYGRSWGRALLDVRPFEQVFEDDLPWHRLHENVRSGVVRALIVSALNVANGRTVSFVELAPGGTYVPSRDPRRASRIEPITSNHVLASAALPLLFPARRVGSSYYCDGGLRFNTPMAPAIRAGAERLLVIALRAGRPAGADDEGLADYPNPVFLLGKILDALLLDPIEYDLQVLDRLNRVLEVLSEAVPTATVDRVGRVLEADRGLPYRRVDTLVFRPSQDIGVLALEHFRKRRSRLCSGTATTFLLENAAALGAHVEADFLSYVLFDGEFARTLIDLGREDVKRRAAEVEAFFSRSDLSREASPLQKAGPRSHPTCMAPTE